VAVKVFPISLSPTTNTTSISAAQLGLAGTGITQVVVDNQSGPAAIQVFPGLSASGPPIDTVGAGQAKLVTIGGNNLGVTFVAAPTLNLGAQFSILRQAYADCIFADDWSLVGFKRFRRGQRYTMPAWFGLANTSILATQLGFDRIRSVRIVNATNAEPAANGSVQVQAIGDVGSSIGPFPGALLANVTTSALAVAAQQVQAASGSWLGIQVTQSGNYFLLDVSDEEDESSDMAAPATLVGTPFFIDTGVLVTPAASPMGPVVPFGKSMYLRRFSFMFSGATSNGDFAHIDQPGDAVSYLSPAAPRDAAVWPVGGERVISGNNSNLLHVTSNSTTSGVTVVADGFIL
jgi:hypothetical protein